LKVQMLIRITPAIRAKAKDIYRAVICTDSTGIFPKKSPYFLSCVRVLQRSSLLCIYDGEHSFLHNFPEQPGQALIVCQQLLHLTEPELLAVLAIDELAPGLGARLPNLVNRVQNFCVGGRDQTG